MKSMEMRISLIGTGRMGIVLGRLLKAKGLPVVSVLDTSHWRMKHAAIELGARSCGSAKDIDPDTDITFICVPDDAIGDVAANLAADSPLKAKSLVAHTSGLLSSVVLEPLRDKGLYTSSFHPCYSFTGTEFEIPQISVAIEGQNRARRKLDTIAELLGWEPISFASHQKPLYHAACVMASNYLVALLSMAETTMQDSGIKDGLTHLMPLIESNLNNILRYGARDSMTGPIVRGDAGSVRLHLEALKKHDPGLVDAYIALGKQTLKLAAKRLEKEKIEEIKALFDRYMV